MVGQFSDSSQVQVMLLSLLICEHTVKHNVLKGLTCYVMPYFKCLVWSVVVVLYSITRQNRLNTVTFFETEIFLFYRLLLKPRKEVVGGCMSFELLHHNT